MSRSGTIDPSQLNTVSDLKKRFKAGEITPQGAFFELIKFVIPNVSKLNNTSEETTVSLFSSDQILGPIFHDGEHLWKEYLIENPYGKSSEDKERLDIEKELYRKYQQWKQNLREESESQRRAM